MNALKVFVGSVRFNGVAVVPFAVAGKISWGIALVVAVGAIRGPATWGPAWRCAFRRGWCGSSSSRSARWLMTVTFFLHTA